MLRSARLFGLTSGLALILIASVGCAALRLAGEIPETARRGTLKIALSAPTLQAQTAKGTAGAAAVPVGTEQVCLRVSHPDITPTVQCAAYGSAGSVLVLNLEPRTGYRLELILSRALPCAGGDCAAAQNWQILAAAARRTDIRAGDNNLTLTPRAFEFSFPQNGQTFSPDDESVNLEVAVAGPELEFDRALIYIGDNWSRDRLLDSSRYQPLLYKRAGLTAQSHGLHYQGSFYGTGYYYYNYTPRYSGSYYYGATLRASGFSHQSSYYHGGYNYYYVVGPSYYYGYQAPYFSYRRYYRGY